MSSGSKTRDLGQKRGGGFRLLRVEREIRDIVAGYLINGCRGELPGIISVSRVVASKDLRNAKVLITALDPNVDRKALLEELQEHAHEVQQVVNQRLRMKYCPRLSFHYDTGMEHALKVESILRDLSLERAAREVELDDGSDPESED